MSQLKNRVTFILAEKFFSDPNNRVTLNKKNLWHNQKSRVTPNKHRTFIPTKRLAENGFFDTKSQVTNKKKVWSLTNQRHIEKIVTIKRLGQVTLYKKNRVAIK